MQLESNMARWAIAAAGLLVIVGSGALPAVDRGGPGQGVAAIAYVNSEAILQQTPGYAEADSAFGVDLEAFQQEIRTLQQQLDSAAAAYDQQQVVLSPSARSEKAEELNQLNRQLQSRQQELSNRAQERQRELMAPFEQRIQTVLDGVRAERNLAVIFDVASPSSNIISADPSLDLTPIIIRRIQGGGGGGQ
jgi:outer membrane protein